MVGDTYGVIGVYIRVQILGLASRSKCQTEYKYEGSRSWTNEELQPRLKLQSTFRGLLNYVFGLHYGKLS